MKYMVIANKVVKEKEFFISQGGDKQDWGKDWKEVEAESIEDARKKGCDMFPWASSL